MLKADGGEPGSGDSSRETPPLELAAVNRYRTPLGRLVARRSVGIGQAAENGRLGSDATK
jgi:hypothetical protein